jgi:outer membrane protein assembly factor BamB
MKKILSVLFLAAVAGLGTGAEWTQFRGPAGGAFSQEKDLPVKWDKETGLRYKVALPGRGLSNPVIAGGRIYLTACSGFREKRLHVLCLDEATGKKLWERQFTSTGNTGCHPMTNMAAPTPVTDGKAVYALFATGDLAALDREGTLLWYRSLVGDYPSITNQVGMASSPVLAGNVLCLPLENAGDSFAAGIDKRTGKNLWKVKRDKNINWVSPLVIQSGGKATVVYQTANEATAYDPETGSVRWKVEGGFTTIPSPAASPDMLFLTGGEVKGLKLGGLNEAPQEAWASKRLLVGGGFASPVYHDGKLYGLTGTGINCLDAKTGEEAFKLRLKGPFDASPVIADGKLYAVNRTGLTSVIELGEKPRVVATNDLGDTILATPAIANGCIYLRSDKWLYCVGAKK